MSVAGRSLLGFLGAGGLALLVGLLCANLEAVDVDVVIVGAGIAGISAAHALATLGVGSVLVLEARARIGGRIEAVELENGGTANVGASWIHRAEGNPITNLADRHGCAYVPTLNANSRFFDATGASLPAHMATATMASLKRIMNRVLKILSESNFDDEMDLETAIRGVEQRYTTHYTAAERSLMELHYFRNIVQDHTADLSELIASEYNEGFFGGMGHDVLLLTGMECIFEPLLRHAIVHGAALELGVKVVEVHQHPAGWLGFHGSRSELVTIDGRVIKARRVVVTVPLGVLKASVGIGTAPAKKPANKLVERDLRPAEVDGNGVLQFDPPLPPRTRAAIAALGVGHAIRIVLEFPEAFWDSGVESFVLAGRRRGDGFGKGDHLEFTAQHFASAPAGAVLVAEADGAFAAELSRLTDPALANLLWERLALVFRNNSGEAGLPPRPTKIYARRFGTDPLTLGALTFPAVGSSDDEEASMSSHAAAFLDASDGSLFFAGEHTSPQMRGTMDGAYWSGVQAAHAVMCSLGTTRPAHHVDVELLKDVWTEDCITRVGATGVDCGEDIWALNERCRREGMNPTSWEPIL